MVKNIVYKTTANYLIGIDALKKADMSFKDFSDADRHLVNNAVETVSKVAGSKGLTLFQKLTEEVQK